MHRPPFTPRKIPGTHFCQRLSRPQGHSVAGRIRSTEKCNNIVGNQTHSLLACSIVPQPITLPCVPPPFSADVKNVWSCTPTPINLHGVGAYLCTGTALHLPLLWYKHLATTDHPIFNFLSQIKSKWRPCEL
jgi:hypothetical protein